VGLLGGVQKTHGRELKNSRKTDIVSRFGGDEFLVLLNNLNSSGDIPVIIEKKMGVFDRPFVVDGRVFYHGQCGSCPFSMRTFNPEALIRKR
jgi:GGDEF domain-containing protein